MAWSFQDIKYGWKIGAAAVLAGGITIYTAVNVQNRITQRDAIQVILATVERALATQTGTNADGSGIYSVTPPSFVRNWYSNDYVSTVTNGVTNWTAVLYTNIFTNVISERLDRAMLVDLDAKIIALCPYYVDTNTVYDGTTNIVMLTFTGLLTSLNLGDHTNFTSIPAIGTNAAVYGPWAWRNYVVAWQERYKVLNALKITRNEVYAQGLSCVFQYSDWSATWAGAKLSSETYTTNAYHTPENGTLIDVLHTGGVNSQPGIAAGGQYKSFNNSYFACLNATYITNLYIPVINNTNLTFTTIVKYICSSNQTFRFLDSGYASEVQMDFDGYGVFEQGGWKTLTFSVPFGIDPRAPIPHWSVDPKGYTNGPYEASVKGFNLQDVITFVDWQFNYCAVKYW